ncbi:MAG: hypothetical protein OQK82_05105, partial [Candidatus Pacearchaeota archaeon]|nr:hypothetical protein [Candidatus Pacearchaeota archaeon]
VTLTGANTATANFTSPVVLVQDGAQILSFTLTATDNEGAVITDTMTVTVNPVNATPTAYAGLDQTVDEQTVVTLTGSASDTDGSIATYAWTQTSGVPVTLTGAATASASFMAPVVLVQDGAQVLSFTLTVTDNEGSVVTDTMTVTVNPVNASPTVDAGIDQSKAEGTLVNLIATASDSDGSIASYAWTQLSGPSVVLDAVDTGNANFISPLVYQDTSLVFQVLVTDNEGAQTTDSITIVVYSTNPDDDADGMDDLWEVSTFGDMSRDGNGDFDNDGFTDYQEYQQGTNPLAYTLPAPTAIKAVADDSQVTMSWTPVDGAVAYNLYWSASPGVTSNSGTLIPNVSSGFVHTGLTNGMTYYYVVTVLSAEDESAVSEEVSATPGIRAWNAPERIDTGTFNNYKPQISVNKHGQAVAIWSQYDGVTYSAWVNHRDPETGWGVAQEIESVNSGNAYYPQVAINDNGNAMAVWEQFDGVSHNVWANHYDSQSGWGTAERIENNSQDRKVYFHPEVMMDKNGNAIAVWQKTSAGVVSIWANRYDASLGWQTAQTIETNDRYHAYDPQIAMDAAGNAVVVWGQYDGKRYNILSNRYDMSTGWSTEEIIDNNTSGSAFDVQISMDSQGNAVAVWQQAEAKGKDKDKDKDYHVWANYYDLESGWSAAQQIEANDEGDKLYYHPQVAMDDKGNAIAVWQQLDGETVGIWANHLVNRIWSTAEVIEPIDFAHSLNPQVAMDVDGNAVVVWEQYDSKKGEKPNKVKLKYPRKSVHKHHSRRGQDDDHDDDRDYDYGWTYNLHDDDDEDNERDEHDDNQHEINDKYKKSVWTTRYSIYQDDWLQPRPLETIDNVIIMDPQIGMDDYGNAVAIWWSSKEIHSASDGLIANPPVAAAGPDQSGYSGELISLDGSGSYDQAGQSLSYYWTQLSGKEVTLNGNTSVTPTLNLPGRARATNLEYILTVTNSNGFSMTDTVVVSSLRHNNSRGHGDHEQDEGE